MASRDLDGFDLHAAVHVSAWDRTIAMESM
jgi:hypothetical protein